nr:TolC family protein [Sphingomonas quercus]
MLATAAPVLAQSDLPPEPLVEQVLELYPGTLAADADVAAARAEGRALATGAHEVTLTGTVSRRSVENDRRFAEYDGTLSRAFRLPGKARLDRQAGALGVEIAQNLAEDARHQAALTLAQLWYDWVRAGEQHRNAEALVANQDAAAAAVRRRVALRDAAPLDLEQALSAVAAARVQVADALAERERARALLAGTFAELALPAEPPRPATPAEPAEGLDQLRDWAVERSHDITAAARTADQKAVLASRARLDRIADPSVGVRVFSERGGEEQGAGLYASIPFGGGHRRALADQASAQASAATAQSSLTRRKVEAEAAADLAETRARLSAWAASREAVARAEASARLSARGQDLGEIDLADRLYAERQANDARRLEIEARVNADLAILKLRIDAHSLWIH